MLRSADQSAAAILAGRSEPRTSADEAPARQASREIDPRNECTDMTPPPGVPVPASHPEILGRSPHWNACRSSHRVLGDPSARRRAGV